MELNAEQREEFDTFCQGLLDGSVEPPNEFVGFMVTKLTEARGEMGRCDQQIVHWSNQLTTLRGGAQRYEEDINEWVKKHLFPELVELKKPEVIAAPKGPTRRKRMTKPEKARAVKAKAKANGGKDPAAAKS